jgi:hypothetical protein
MQSAHIPFCKRYLKAHASKPVVELLDEVGLLDGGIFPNSSMLNALAQRFYGKWSGPVFKDQGTFEECENRYYETIISEDNTVPTREKSWHDLFNALIWLQFPKTKKYLNTLHVNDIVSYGANPRTERRNRITHFDECGLVLAVELPAPLFKNGSEGQKQSATNADHKLNAVDIAQWLNALANHQWHDVFIQNRSIWHNRVTPFIFGHANLEMMLSPFIGLTGKWLAVPVAQGFGELEKWEQRQMLDEAMLKRLNELNDFNSAPLLKPLPLLGIPNWHNDQTPAFYANKDYFRPVRANAKPTIQLPL